MDEIIISNKNRDGSKIWLEQISDNEYIIKADKDYVLNYACENYDNLPLDSEIWDFSFVNSNGDLQKGKIYSFDPAGGPYMVVGSKINNNIIERIYHKNNDVIFVLK